MTYLGGVESDDKLVARNDKYLRRWDSGEGRQFRVSLGAVEQMVGSVGYWLDEWNGEESLEIGWTIDPAHWGRGIARAAVALVLDDAARQHPGLRAVAIVHQDNAASNALCRRLGFTLAGQAEHDNPGGTRIVANEWVISPVVR